MGFRKDLQLRAPLRKILGLASALIFSIRAFGLGYTPTDCGLVVDLQPGDKILLSTWIDLNENGIEDPGEEFFVNHYNGYTGGEFKYSAGNTLKLIPQDLAATEPASVSVWTIEEPLTRPNNLVLGGLTYTMWSSDGYTLKTNGTYKYQGVLSKEVNNSDLCDVVFVIPTNHPGITSLDPNNTMKRKDLNADSCFNGAMATGFLGMTYREVFWLDIPRSNGPNSYTNASLVGFNTTKSDYKYATNKGETAKPGQALYAFADIGKHDDTQRTLFRLYILNKPFKYCPSTYFFGYDEQDYKRYRRQSSGNLTDSTARKKVYYVDRFEPMSRIGETRYYAANYKIPESDSTYFFVGYNNEYKNSGLGANGAKSQFTKIGLLPIKNHAAEAEQAPFSAPKGAYGRVIADTTSTADNLNVYFHPAGIFLRTSNDVNVEMVPEGDTAWITREMWRIDASYEPLSIKATLMTGPTFSLDDPGADVPGWSDYYHSTEVPVFGNETQHSLGKSGWARVRTLRTRESGKAWMEFIEAETDRFVRYENNHYFGTAIPDQYPKKGETTVVIEDPRLVNSFEFKGWYTKPDTTEGGGIWYQPGDKVTLKAGDTLKLYAQAVFKNSLHVAISFRHPTNNKRYFLTYPGPDAPRFARARSFEDWTNVVQGAANADNNTPNFLNTFRMVYNNTFNTECKICGEGRGLEPKQETMKGAEDSLVFYEDFTFGSQGYMGLYDQTDWNVILANQTWTGLFKSTMGWPDVRKPYIDSTRLYSDTYLSPRTPTPQNPAPWTLVNRPEGLGDTIVYDPVNNQFNGTTGAGTDFQITAVSVVDAHYVILPDTTVPWTDMIIFPYHQGEQGDYDVWSKLIGKHLLAAMTVDKDTVYFHPDRNAILTQPSELRLSSNYRLTQTFDYIRDERVEGLGKVAADDKPILIDTDDEFRHILIGGINSPMDIQYNGQYIDIVDTIRITLRPTGSSRIKEYYGRWKDGAEGLHINPDGSRYRDILVTTKTYHYGETETKVVLKPQYDIYRFSPLKDASQKINFTLARVTSRPLLDANGVRESEEILSSTDITTESLRLAHTHCTFKNGASCFTAPDGQSQNNYVTVMTVKNTETMDCHDTLIVTYPFERENVVARVSLFQPKLSNTELIWSVMYDNVRYYIMGSEDKLIFRRFKVNGNTLNKLNANVRLIIGSKDAANSDDQYITPWKYEYDGSDGQKNQVLTLKAEYGINKYLTINNNDSATVGVSPTVLYYDYDTIYVSENANYEEIVRLRYGDPVGGKWLRFHVVNGRAKIDLVGTKEEASSFSWTYLQLEYSLLNYGDYPDYSVVEFGYNDNTPFKVQTRFQAYKEYSLLLGNKTMYCARVNEATIANLVDSTKEWKLRYDISLTYPDSSHLSISTNEPMLQTTITPLEGSPVGEQDIWDFLNVRIRLRNDPNAPKYKFKEAWSGYTSVEDLDLQIPVIRKAYHTASYDSLVCTVNNDEHHFAFPATLGESDSLHTFSFQTWRRSGTNTLDQDNHAVSHDPVASVSMTDSMKLNEAAYAEIRLLDDRGTKPDWCTIQSIGSNSVTIKCLKSGLRSPRSTNLYIVYVVKVDGEWRYVNFRMTVSQESIYRSSSNQHLMATEGASGDTLVNGVQQVHENRRVLYYYNPACTDEADQETELPIRERGFYGWWRWYDETDGPNKGMDIQNWATPPSNSGNGKHYAFRVIGGKVPVDPNDPGTDSILITQGRYTIFYHPSKNYDRNDPPAKNPRIVPPTDKSIKKYVVDLSNYYDNLPLSVSNVNQIDTAKLDTMKSIKEPTLSLREIFELHPWTEMADTMDHYKSYKDAPYDTHKYMEDHVVRAPTGSRLLLKTEQRYNYENLQARKHSESLLGYYMHDDNWYTWTDNPNRQDTMIWVAGWEDVAAKWYTYDKTNGYKPCTYNVTVDDDFLNVPARATIPGSKTVDTVVYCLRARSQKTTFTMDGGKESEETVEGDSIFNICRYTIIYHRPAKYGPLLESNDGRALLISNAEIEQNFEVLERLNFDYNKTGVEYQVYKHPLPWADASYGYSYPMTDELPDNRHHNQDGLINFPNMGEYGLINKIPYDKYWHKMEQHGGGENGYMIYCDGMSSSGQVAAITLSTKLCEGQKMYFSGFVGNPVRDGNKARPNFLFSVQGSVNGTKWEDVTSYMTGDIPPSNKWYQVYFPIEQNKEYPFSRVRIYNMASEDDGNDFIIDDMCIFATKPPLMVYQANTTCKIENEGDSTTHIVLRVDYQGFNEDMYQATNAYYCIDEVKPGATDTTFVKLEDGYYNQDVKEDSRTSPAFEVDTLYGVVPMPERHYEPVSEDSIFSNLQELIAKFEQTLDAHEEYEKDNTKPNVPVFRQGYIYEHLDDSIRPVMYIVHTAKMVPENTYIVHMAGSYNELRSSHCAMTSRLKVRNHMMLELNGEEYPEKEVNRMCANTTYDVSLRVRGTLLLDSVAPIDINGSCFCDWLLYDDTAAVSSKARYGYKYSDIEAVIKNILRSPSVDGGTNENQFARSMAEINPHVLNKVQIARKVELSPGVHAYNLLDSLVSAGFLTLYQSKLTVTTRVNDSIQYTIFPIEGTGSEIMQNMNIEVCPTPVHIKLKSALGQGLPMIIGGLNRKESELRYPITVLADELEANTSFAIPIDSLMLTSGLGGGQLVQNVAIDSIILRSTNDPEFLEGIHQLVLVPDRHWQDVEHSSSSYYQNHGDTLLLTFAPTTNYHLRPGYSYTFGIEMMTNQGQHNWENLEGDCAVGTVPFTLSVVPNYLRWDPQRKGSNKWNDPKNWIGINQKNEPIHADARFAPLRSTYVVIPPMPDTLPYPVLSPTPIPIEDSIQMVGFQYNTCYSIRFMSGAALSQQQQLTYDSVIADLSLPQDKWALRATPIMGMITGDIFMSNADLTWQTSPWEVGLFDANGRSYTTGNASYWISFFNQETTRVGNTAFESDTVRSADGNWSKVTNGLTEPLRPGQGWAIYSHTASGQNATVRLPKNDDTYYYYTKSGEKVYTQYEPYLQSKRATLAGGAENVGKLAFHPDGSAQAFTLSNGMNKQGGAANHATNTFVFGNPTMGYIDIWGFIADNPSVLTPEIHYVTKEGNWLQATRDALSETDTTTSLSRYLPPMHALMLTKSGDPATEITVTLNANRIVTAASQRVPVPASAPRRQTLKANGQSPLAKGLMTVTAVNPASSRCTSRLILGQGFNSDILPGEDAILATVNIDNYTNNTNPATPFNIYALEGTNGLSIDLMDSIVYVPISFVMTPLPYAPVTHLWFTGVNNIRGPLVLYDAFTDTERPIIDGIRLDIETPEVSHTPRYYIRRPGYTPAAPSDDYVATDIDNINTTNTTNVTKILKSGHVYILRDGHVYTMYGQQLR